MTLAGFPHSDIDGSALASSSPSLFAGSYVLHRLPVPRHPPCALISLTARAALVSAGLCQKLRPVLAYWCTLRSVLASSSPGCHHCAARSASKPIEPRYAESGAAVAARVIGPPHSPNLFGGWFQASLLVAKRRSAKVSYCGNSSSKILLSEIKGLTPLKTKEQYRTCR